ncbi:MAG: hypothetical protein OXE85_12325 [Roseovarius sp.]|nr:hypothetical protein [Roseovarius sp.]MCY4315397.1 hypothetical protein [Roseovarius sp.]
MSEPNWLAREDVEAIHEQMIEIGGGAAAFLMIPSRCLPRKVARLALDAYALSASTRRAFAPTIICSNSGLSAQLAGLV